MQGVLWSKDIESIDTQKDKVYIIHQILSHGRMEDIQWLFRTYPESLLKQVFTDHPYKNYSAARFNFVKNYILHLEQHSFNEKYYVKNVPRDIR